MKKCLKTWYKILNSVLLAFINLNLELLYFFVHFSSLYGETLMHYSELVGQLDVSQKILKIQEYKALFFRIVCEVTQVNFPPVGVNQLLHRSPWTRRSSQRHQ